MVEPFAVLGAVGKGLEPAAVEAAKTGHALMLNLFGPMSEQVGQDLLERYKNRNVKRVAQRAEELAPEGDGSVPLRVGGAVFDAAAFADNEVVAEYLSGVLASSRSKEGTDDSGVSWSALISRLSSDQLKLHYLLYGTAATHFAGLELTSIDKLRAHWIYVPVPALSQALTEENSAPRFNGALMNIQREGLLSDDYWLQKDSTKLHKLGRQVPAGTGMVYKITPSGVGLYLWGIGRGRESVLRFHKVDNIQAEALKIEIPVPGSALLDSFPPA